MPLLKDLALSRQEEIQRAIADAERATSAAESLQILLSAIDGVREEVASVAVDEVTVNNLDEVKASLRNELNRISRPIIKAIKALSLDRSKLEEITKRVEAENAVALEETHDIQIVKKPKQRIEISNLSDLAFPGAINVSNLDELQKYFDSLAQVVRSTFKIDVPVPQVTVKPPEVNVSVPDIQLPEIKIPDISIPDQAKTLRPLLDAIKNLKDTIRRTSANQAKQMTAFSGGLTESGARKAFKQALAASLSTYGDFRKTVTTGGTAERLSATSLPVKWAIVTAEENNTNVVCIGGSTVVAALATRRGKPLFPAQDVTLENVDLKEVYLDAITDTEGVTVFYAK